MRRRVPLTDEVIAQAGARARVRANGSRAVGARVRSILRAVRSEGDDALRRYARELDHWEGPIDCAPPVREEAAGRVPPEVQQALSFAAERIRSFHQAQRPTPTSIELPGGSKISLEFHPLRRVGLYVPGGRAPYPSTTLMTALCARAAGVPEILLATPPRPGTPGGLDPSVAFAAELAKVDRIFLTGGAAAIGAFAYGTASVPRVEKVFGPGNAYVNAAKRELFGEVGIDLLAGPSESLLVFDESLPMEFAVREALSQLEHGPDSRAFVVTCAPGLGRAFRSALAALSEGPGGSSDTREDLTRRVELYETADPRQAWRYADALAPESLLVVLSEDSAWERDPPRCGSLFLGPWSAVAFGDYVSGSNHVLPVLGSARFSGGLSVYDFGRWVASQRITEGDARSLAPPGATIATAEGMRWHAEAQRVRSKVPAHDGGSPP